MQRILARSLLPTLNVKEQQLKSVKTCTRDKHAVIAGVLAFKRWDFFRELVLSAMLYINIRHGYCYSKKKKIQCLRRVAVEQTKQSS